MPDKQQPEPLRIAALLEKTGAQGSLRDEAASELRRLHAENDALRTGYEAARLEIESLKARPAGALQPSPAAQGDALDAARYRWLAASCRSTSEHWGGRWSIIIDGPAPKSHDSEDDFDAAIDAARAAQEGNKP